MKILQHYGYFGLVKIVINVIKTRIFFHKARLIRFPFDIRGKNFVKIDEGFTTGVGCRVEALPEGNYKTLFIGKNFQMNDYVHITAMQSVIIGDNVLLASKIYISDCTHGSYGGDDNDSHPDTPPDKRSLFSKPVIIEDNVWLGEFVSVLPGVTIGKGTIVGANSVVSKSLPPYVIAVGSPAKPIKCYNFDTQKWEKIC
ncbi:DapH/DapD/GlmU-related protein [Acinetobacter nematophilus]|uniref:DapH/DapD/GlmU-related protein n=1 Tax=Acinetobacter nematophilus TaxID=2994642 RepID=A0A9X3DXA3_9GAMM|nr:DapH/DapD/GlmU-related protein [Acinetobacter nematophilus]MCX5469848.1 DapH/DapD/GlmU-related protein [Acinetobacter nematophilus]